MTEESNLQKLLQQVNLPTKIEKINLPSGGLFYGKNSSLRGKTELEMKQMTTKEEDILTTRSLLESGEAIPRVLQSLIQTNNVRSGDLNELDSNQVVIFSRIISYGPDYQVKIKCPKCGSTTEHEVDLFEHLHDGEIDVTELKHSKYDSETGCFNVTLPVSELVVKMRLLTTFDMVNIVKEAKRKKKKDILKRQGVSEQVKATLRRVVSISKADTFIDDPLDIQTLFLSLSAKDSSFMRVAHSEIVSLIEKKTEFVCSNDDCGYEEEIGLEYGPTFFRPDA